MSKNRVMEQSRAQENFMKPESAGEKIYVMKRKFKAFCYGLPFIICRIFPIKKNKIVLWTFEGTGGYGCSPRYIAEEILKQRRQGNNNYMLYWMVKDTSKAFPEGIKIIEDTHLNRAYHMTTAGYWIGNTRTFYGTKKRKGTKYIQTWHGSLSLKPIGLCRGDKLSRIAYLVSKADSDLIDVVISGSGYCTEMWRDGLIYNGKIETIGTPRIDVLINEVERKHIELRREYGIPEGAKIAVYAPTFRGGSQGTKRSVSEGEISLDFEKAINALEKRFGGTWYMFLRLHPQLSVFMKGMTTGNVNPAVKGRLIDVTQRPDMNEIMAATDAIITDYSTCLFEGFLTGQPGFIYADDWDEYIADRGKLMFEPNEIPFSVAKNNKEFYENIVTFDEKKYKEKYEEIIRRCEVRENGHASEATVKLIQTL